jgi:hypothetical protein
MTCVLIIKLTTAKVPASQFPHTSFSRLLK